MTDILDFSTQRTTPPAKAPQLRQQAEVVRKGRFSTRGKFEHIPKWLNLFPMVAQWIWLGLKYRSIPLPSSANPNITSGGMVGDGKLEYIKAMGPHARGYMAETIGITVDDHFSVENTLNTMREKDLDFPVVVKPDIGWCGYGVRRVNTRDELRDYAEHYPNGETFLVQRHIASKGEAGIFYIRDPDAATGSILGILLRAYPEAIGDGKRTLEQIASGDPRLKRSITNKLHQPGFDRSYIPGRGERVRLSLIGSTRVGGLYCDGTGHATVELTRHVDEIARDMKNFHVGRFDVRYRTLEELKRGNFTIIEVNGSGSEVVHAWDPKYTIYEVYKMVFAKQRILFALSDKMRRRGYEPVSFRELARLHFRQQRLMKSYPRSN